jgi:exosortase
MRTLASREKTDPSPGGGGGPAPNQLCWLASLAIGWLWTWKHLSLEWRFNDQYQYGYAIPLLAIYSGWLRWTASPAESPPAPGHRIIVGSALAACWGLFVVGEALRENDPGWRVCAGALMAAMSGSTLVWFYRCGGARLARSMLFPVGFAWLGLPWPSGAEHFLVRQLTGFLTSFVILVLNFCAIPAAQHGNVIALGSGAVGIDDACSGIQSFQSSLMASLFLGEWFGLSGPRRAGLVVAGWGVAFAGNFARVLGLTLLVNAHGAEMVPRYHDPLGYAATFAIFLGIYAIASLRGAKHEEESSASRPFRLPVIAGREGLGVAGAALLAPLLVFAWFHGVVESRSSKPQPDPVWVINTNQPGNGWQATPVAPTAIEKRLLRFSLGEAWKIQDAGSQAELYHFFWRPDEGFSSMAYIHTPDVCMPSVGWNLDAMPEPVTLRVHGVDVRGGLYSFSQGAVREVVFQSICYGGKTMSTIDDPYATGSRSKRLAMLWRKPRQQINEELLLYCPSSGSRQTDLGFIHAGLEAFLDPRPLHALANDPSEPSR